MLKYSKILKRKFVDLNINSKFGIFCFIILIVSIFLSNIIYQRVYANITLNKVSDLSVQTLYSIESNLDLTINNINSYSKMILSDNDLQNLLRSEDIYSDLDSQERLSKYLYKLMQEVPVISSVHIFDNSNNEFSVSYKSDYKFLPENIKTVKWYNSVINEKGAYILSLNGGGVFENSSEGNFISMVRLVRDINTTDPIGILVINISENAFEGLYSNILSNYNTNIIILNENNESIINSAKIDKTQVKQLLSGFDNKEAGFLMKTFKKKEVLASYLKLNNYDWKIISTIPSKELSNENSTTSLIGFIIIIINSVLLFVGAILTSRMITIPINKLLKSMKGLENGIFKEVEINTGNNEIGKLKDGYNIMISEIKKLIKGIIEEQSIKRKLELEALQAQVKPHFLYNTLDSISSLALLGRTKDVCEMIDSLGYYYRKSLSNGNEIITLNEEFQIVKNYLKIQEMRYGDKLSTKFELDKRCNDYQIPKLVLQPLVENAIYHGVRLKSKKGLILIKSVKESCIIRIEIEDNGIGMSKEMIDKILFNNKEFNNSGFGIIGTIKRLKIFYSEDNCFKIESEKNIGTKITIMIPILKEMEGRNIE
ncbi:MAG: sensor histidine kinase [Clostridiales bacterium]